MPADDFANFAERFNREGGPIPETDADHLKQMWKGVRVADANFADTTKTCGLGALGLAPADLGNPSTAEFSVLFLRLNLLRALFKRDVLRDYLVGGELRDEVFRAAAGIPCDKDELAEALIHATWDIFPAEAVSEFKAKMVSEGYDPDAPRMDAKFLSWLREH